MSDLGSSQGYVGLGSRCGSSEEPGAFEEVASQVVVW